MKLTLNWVLTALRLLPIHSSSREPTQPPIQWVPGALSLGVKRLGREADHSPPSSAEVKNAWSYTSTILYEGVSKISRTELITKCTLTTINTLWEATQRVMAVKLTRLTHKIAIQPHLVADGYTICGSRSRRPVRKLLDTHPLTS
jgi:hypothetical protein